MSDTLIRDITAYIRRGQSDRFTLRSELRLANSVICGGASVGTGACVNVDTLGAAANAVWD
ncbi:MAG: hypothetical protein ACXV8J_07865 [Methylobacter sp.]